jgi:hypothetical protein
MAQIFMIFAASRLTAKGGLSRWAGADECPVYVDSGRLLRANGARSPTLQ